MELLVLRQHVWRRSFRRKLVALNFKAFTSLLDLFLIIDQNVR